MLIVVSGPSGVGKGTLCKMLLDSDAGTCFSVSATTRQPRDGEVEGVHYFFVTEEEFLKLKEEQALLEDAVVHGHRYGTPEKAVRDMLESGKDVILDIDPQGACQVIEKCPDCVAVFILPPSWESLRRRLTLRNTESPEDIERRLSNARQEVQLLHRYRYVIVNEEGEEGKQLAFEALKHIVDAERHQTMRCRTDMNE